MSLAELMVEAMDAEDLVDDVDQVDQSTGRDLTAAVAANDGEHEWRYPTLQAWVHQWLVPTLERDRNRSQLAWCSSWWRHPEAIAVLGALWHQWEASQDQPWTGMATYMAHYHYPLIERLTQPDGPFGACWTDSRSEQVPVHREHSTHFGPPVVIDAVDDDVAAHLGEVEDWMPPPTS